jgi:hypothetical protein
MNSSFSKYLFIFYAFILFALFLYSFTQVDLGLALTRFPAIFSIQRIFQSVGYFNRPLSALLYFIVLLSLFICYAVLLYGVDKNKINRKTVWKLIIISAVVLAFTYNAFSYDLFNYIFDAKIFTYYGQNPYVHKALDFPKDPMLGFMHWTHRTYPYGPVWLGLTIPLSYLGFNYFLVTFFLFKLLAAASFLGAVYFLEKIMSKINANNSLLSVAAFALNPLVLVESLVSGHLDIVMVFFSMVSFYFLISKKYFYAGLLLILSIGVKYATVFLFPVFLAIITMQYMKEKIPWRMFIFTAIACLFISVIAASQQSGNFQPWYLLTLLPFAAIISNSLYVILPVGIISFAALLTYLPFLYTGNWNNPIPLILLYIEAGGLLVAVLCTLLLLCLRQKRFNFIYKLFRLNRK